MFFRFLERAKLLKNRAVMAVALPKIPFSVPKPLTIPKAMDVMQESAASQKRGQEKWIGARDGAALLLLYGSGLRVSEALGLPRRDAPLPPRDIVRVKGKGGKERLVPVLPAIQKAVARYIELCPYAAAARRTAVSAAPRAAGCRPAFCNCSWPGCARRSVCPRLPPRTPYATLSRRTCSEAVPIFARSRNCLVTQAFPPHRFTRKSTGKLCCAFMIGPTPGLRFRARSGKVDTGFPEKSCENKGL